MPEHVEKIVSTYEEFADIPGYARVVIRAELADNDDNLNIRRYADNAPAPEPHDVRAHLHGGVPRAEVADKKDLFTEHGFTTEKVFIDRDDAYLDFAPGVDRARLAGQVNDHPGVREREAALVAAREGWWEEHRKLLVKLPSTQRLMAARAELLNTFITALKSVGLLDRFQLSGVIVRWWDTNQYDLRTLAAQGFGGVIDGWVTTITALLADDTSAQADPLEHRLIPKLVPEYLEELAKVEARRAEMETEIKAATVTSDDTVG